MAIHIREFLSVCELDYKVIVFGTGEDFYRLIDMMNYIFEVLKFEKRFTDCIVCIIDNDKSKQGKNIEGVEVRSPEKLMGADMQYPIIVATAKYYQEISGQLQTMSLVEYQDYMLYEEYMEIAIIYFGLLRNNGIFDLMDEVEKECRRMNAARFICDSYRM